MEKNIGIDFGTTNTVIHSRDAKGKLKGIGTRKLKSAIYFLSRDEYLIGEEALNRVDTKHWQALVTDFKPNIMEKFSIKAENGETFHLKGEAVARLFLNKVLTDYVEISFEKMFGTPEMGNADKTVITVPAKFDAEKKGKIKKAAQKAHFSNVGIAFEPTAAAVAACNSDVLDDIVAVYDFGGGTFDVSVIEKDSSEHYSSVDKDGDPFLGGNLIRDAVAEEILIPLLNQQGIEISYDVDDMDFEDDECPMSEDEYEYNLRTIKSYIDDTLKEHFSDGNDVYEGLINILLDKAEESFNIEITKERFEAVIRPHIEKTVEITRRVVERVQARNKSIKKIIMAGGSSQLLLAETLLKEEFEPDGIEIILSDDVFSLIAKGALLMAEKQRIIRVEEKTTTQFGVGVRTGIGIKKFDMLIDVDQPLPTEKSKRFPIDTNILNVGEVEIPCFEKDVKGYPNASTERDEGVLHINTYRIPVNKKLDPSEIEVKFEIETDGTLNLSAKLYDKAGNQITDYHEEIMSDNELE